MSAFRQSFRKWWQPPRALSARVAGRSVTFLELFYDLVYVVLIAQLAHALAENVTPAGVIGFIFLFIVVWIAWLNGTIYHDLHGNNDIRTRIFTFAQMFTVAAMAIFAHQAIGAGAVGFALSYAAFQLILVYLWWRTGVHDPHHRPLSAPYALTYLLTAFLFVASIFVPPPWRFVIWGMALLFSLVLPFIVFTRGRNNPETQAQIELSLEISPSLVERFGLITIIVLGEVVVGTINGVGEHEQLSWVVGTIAFLGMLVAVAIWWIYFDFVSHRRPRSEMGVVMRWIYLHLPMTMGIAATGAAVFNVVEHAGEPLEMGARWLLSGAIALALICIALLMQSIRIIAELRPPYRRGGLITLVSALLIFLLGFIPLSAILFLASIILLMLTPVFYGIKVWIQVFNAEEITST